MEELLSQVETVRTTLDFSALLLKCTTDGRITEVLHSDLEDEWFNPDGDLFSNLFTGTSELKAKKFITELKTNGKANNVELSNSKSGRLRHFRFNGVKSGNYLLISGYAQITPETSSPTPATCKDKCFDTQISLAESQKLAKIGSYEIVAGQDAWKVSPQMYHLFGWNTDEVFTHETYMDLVHPEDRNQLIAEIEDSIKEGTDFRMLYRARHRNGNWLTICSTGRVELDNNGSLARIVGAKQDLTQHYSMQSALRESEQLYRSIVDGALDAIVIIDQTGIILDWNLQAHQIFGWSRHEAMGKKFDDLLAPLSGQSSNSTVSSAYLNLFRKRIELPAKRKDGTEFLAEVSVSTVTINNRQCYSAFIRNISERRKTETLLIEKKRQLREVSTSIPGVVIQFRKSTSGRYFFTYISKQVTDYTGISVQECYNNIDKVLQRLHPDDLRSVKAAIERSSCTLNTLLQVFRIQLPDTGATHYLQVHAVPGLHETGDIIWNGTIIDVTAVSLAQEKLKASEKQYRELLETITEGVVVADREDNVLLFNKQFCRLTGYAPKELTGSNFRQLLAAFEEDRKLIAEVSRDRWEGKSHNYELRIRTKDHQLLWVKVNAAPLRDENGHITGAIATLLDITHEKAVKEEIQKSEERYRKLFQSNPHPMFVYDRSTLKFLAVNQAALSHYQYTEEEFLQMKRTDLLQPEGIERFNKVLFHAKGKEKYNHTIQHRKKNGELIDVKINASLFQYAEHDGVLVTAQDITDQNRAAFALQDSEARYKSLFEQNPEPVFSIDKQGRIQTANKAFGTLLDTSIEDILGKSYFNFLEPDCYESSSNWFAKVLEGSAQTFYSVIINRHGKRFVVNMTQMPIKVNNQIEGVYCILKDETEILQINQELKKSHQELRELAAHIHETREEERKRIAREIHDELGQVLTALKIDVSLLTRKAGSLKEELTEEFASTINIADEALRSVKRLVSELRPIGIEEFGLLNELRLYAQRWETRYGIKVEVDVPTENLVIAREKAVEVFRIIQESLTNVARHSQASHVQIRIVQEPKNVKVTITDNGVGLSKESRKKEKSFGLIGMRERALVIGALIQINSEENKGTQVQLLLPIQ